MKRTLSMFLAVVMVLTMVAVSVPSAAAGSIVANTGKHTLSENNVGIDVPHFSGSVYYNETTGRWGSITLSYPQGDEALISEKTASSDSKIILDGIISDGEWGNPILDLSSEYAAKKGTSLPSAENTYYYWNGNDGDNFLNLSAGLKYKLWMAWDEDYLLVAAEVLDPDAAKLAAGGKNVWDGDAIQMRIDPEGPNSIVGGGSYDPSVNKYPFKSSDKKDAADEKYAGYVSNIGMGYLDSGSVDMQDMAMRYYPHEEEVLTADGKVDYIATVWSQSHSYWLRSIDGATGEEEPDAPFGYTYGSYQSAFTRNAANRKECKSVYEFAIPWHYMDGSYIDYDKTTEAFQTVLADYVPTAGDEFGIAIALLNAGRGGAGYNSWLTWGSGICGDQLNGNDFMTAGGSNSMLLVADELGTINNCEHTFTEPDCTQPYVCTKCGYEKGFSTGHDYSHTVTGYPTAAEDGAIVSTCATCSDVHTQVLPAAEKNVWHQFTGENDIKDASGEWSADGFTYLYVEKDADGNDTTIPIIDPITNQQKDVIEEYDGRTVIDLTNDRPGTYFATASYYQTYSYKYDFRLTGAEFPADEIINTYEDGFYHWFGGAHADGGKVVYGLSYVAGFFPTEHNATTGVFRIAETNATTFDKNTGERLGKIIAESPVVDLGTDWHTFNFVFDDETDTAMMYCDDKVMCGVWNPDFDLDGQTTQALMRRFHVSCMIADMAIGNPTAFTYSEAPVPTGYTVTCDGNVIGTYEAGETVELPVPEAYEGNRFFTWEGADVERGDFSSRNTTANKRVYTLVMPENDVELTSVFIAVGDADQNGRLKATDLAAIKSAVSGNSAPTDEQVEAMDINLDGRLKASDLKDLKMYLGGNGTIDQ